MGKEGSSSLTCCCPPHLLLPSFPITHLPASLYLWDHGERRNASGGGVGKSESLATLTLHGNMIGDGGARGQGR